MAHTTRKLLEENWDGYCNTLTEYQRKEVEKMINCSKQSCNSRICSSCGKRFTDQWAEKLNLLPVKHQHIVLTVPAILRTTLRDWNNVKILMDCSSLFLKNMSRAKI